MSEPNCASKTGVPRPVIRSDGQDMRCVGDHVWQADDGTLRFGDVAARERWYAEHRFAELQTKTPPWLPWVAGGLAVGAVVWLIRR